MKVGITGAAGHIGTTLREGLSKDHALTMYDIKNVAREPDAAIKSILIDLTLSERIQGLFDGLDAVIHLAAVAHPRALWDSVLKDNIVMTHNVFEECRRAGVQRIVFASTNHVLHGHTMGPEPDTLDADFYREGKPLLTLHTPPAPDSLYGVSKLFGEDLGRYYAHRFGLRFVALRIGWTIREDDPSIKRGTPAEDYMRAMFLSKRDCVTAFSRSLEVEMASGETVVAFAISNNSRRLFDLEETRKKLGFNPADNAEDYF
ncbi:MAG: NAD(P)-dependent oxidoreductase [Candidatus Aureabacteria bacterium]|nr:NAD(P)-dependent oxidoreductase [Candidatus Auribacterota bacterium]